MVASTTRASSSAKPSPSKLKSSSQTSTSSSSTSSPVLTTKRPSSASLVQSSAKKQLAKTKKAKGSNKFRDSEKRELLDGQTTQLFQEQSASSEKGEGGDPFSYNLPSRTDQRRTRAQIDEAALALDLLMKS